MCRCAGISWSAIWHTCLEVAYFIIDAQRIINGVNLGYDLPGIGFTIADHSSWNGRRLESPNSLRHHWVGTAFFPSATLARVLQAMQFYERYPEMYRPNVRRSVVLSHDGGHYVVWLQLFTKKIISVVVNTESDVRYIPIGETRMQVRSTSVRIAEVENPGTPQEREKPVGRDNGFMWRFNNYCALDERDGGTYVQCESVSLSRDIPFGLGWIVGSFVSSVPRESLEFTLAALRAAVNRSAVR